MNSIVDINFLDKFHTNDWVKFVSEHRDTFSKANKGEIFHVFIFVIGIESASVSGYFLTPEADDFLIAVKFVKSISQEWTEWVNKVLNRFPNNKFIEELDARTDFVIAITDDLENDVFEEYIDEYFNSLKASLDSCVKQTILNYEIDFKSDVVTKEKSADLLTFLSEGVKEIEKLKAKIK